MELKNKFILKFSIGFSIGAIICTLISAIITTNSMNDGNTYILNPLFSNMFSNEIIALAVEMIISGFYVAICMGGTIIYEIDEWSPLKSTIVHFLITIITLILTASILKWWDYKNMIFNLTFLSSMTLMYIIIWLIQYAIYKREAKIIKEGIKKKNTEYFK